MLCALATGSGLVIFPPGYSNVTSLIGVFFLIYKGKACPTPRCPTPSVPVGGSVTKSSGLEHLSAFIHMQVNLAQEMFGN